jgi:hypothetical protein
MGARFYDPALGRWLSADTLVPDPANPQSLNRYSWVLANPLRFVDPTGHFESEEELAEYLGFSSLDSWWNSDLYAAWSQDQEWMTMILSKEFDFGSVLRFESNGTVYETILAQTEYGDLTLWDTNSPGTHSLKQVFESTGYTLWYPKEGGFTGFSLAHSGRNTENLLRSPVLDDHWKGYPGSVTEPHIRIRYGLNWGRILLDTAAIVGGALGAVGEGIAASLDPEPASKLVFTGALIVTLGGLGDTISQVSSGSWAKERIPIMYTTPCCW